MSVATSRRSLLIVESQSEYSNRFSIDKAQLLFCRIDCEFLDVSKVYQNPFKNVVEPENRYAFVASPFKMEMNFKLYYRSGVSSFHEADENILPIYFGFIMHPALKDIIHLKASQLHEAGIISHLFKKHLLENFKRKLNAIGPQVLTLKHLGAGFVLIVALLVLSFVAFAVECAPKLLKKLFDLLLACLIVVKFTNMKKML
jgi:hypothetical protein